MWWIDRSQFVRYRAIFDPAPRLVAPEFIDRAIRLLVEEYVLVVGHPGIETALFPEVLVGGSPIRGGNIDRVNANHAGIEAGERLAAYREPLGKRVFHLALRRRIEPLLPHRKCDIRRALKNRKMCGGAARLLDHLNSAGPRADDADPLARHIEPLLGPESGVMRDALEAVQAFEGRNVRLRTETGAHHDELRLHHNIIVRTNGPLLGAFVKFCTVHPCVKADVPTEIELLYDIFEILAKLLPRRKALRVIPVAPQIFARKLVDCAF